MKRFNSREKNIAYYFYRLVEPVFDPIKFVKGLFGYLWFIRDYLKFSITSRVKPKFTELFPQLHDKTDLTPFDAHYFYQQLWVFEEVLKKKPRKHVDVASTYEMSGYLSKVVPTTFIDYRPIETDLKNLEIMRGDITKLPLKPNSVTSLSCLHVMEHIGLGRYGDPVDGSAYEKGISELQRVLAPDGRLYFSTPVGKEAVYFNAHRVFNPKTILEAFSDLELVSFSVVNDSGKFKEKVDPSKYTNLNYGCGMFLFTKKAKK